MTQRRHHFQFQRLQRRIAWTDTHDRANSLRPRKHQHNIMADKANGTSVKAYKSVVGHRYPIKTNSEWGYHIVDDRPTRIIRDTDFVYSYTTKGPFVTSANSEWDYSYANATNATSGPQPLYEFYQVCCFDVSTPPHTTTAPSHPHVNCTKYQG